MFSILIPTFNNLEYLKICINSKKTHILKSDNLYVCGEDGTIF